MRVRYISKLLTGGKVAIPSDICHLEQFDLRKGSYIKQSVDSNSIVLYKCDSFQEATNGVDIIDSGYVITLTPQYLDQLSVQEGEPLYFSVAGDLIVIEKARCDKCGTLERIVEYEAFHFRCTACISNTIRWEREHRR